MPKKKNKKKYSAIKRASKTVLRFMDQIFQKHRDSHPMGEGFFEDFKEDFDIESYLKDRRPRSQKEHLEWGGGHTITPTKGRNKYESYTELQGVGLYIMSALEIMEIAYESYKTINTQQEEVING